MVDTTYQPKVYHKQGGDTLVVASGGNIDIENGGYFSAAGDFYLMSGGNFNIYSGATLTLHSGATISGLNSALTDLYSDAGIRVYSGAAIDVASGGIISVGASAILRFLSNAYGQFWSGARLGIYSNATLDIMSGATLSMGNSAAGTMYSDSKWAVFSNAYMQINSGGIFSVGASGFIYGRNSARGYFNSGFDFYFGSMSALDARYMGAYLLGKTNTLSITNSVGAGSGVLSVVSLPSFVGTVLVWASGAASNCSLQMWTGWLGEEVLIKMRGAATVYSASCNIYFSGPGTSGVSCLGNSGPLSRICLDYSAAQSAWVKLRAIADGCWYVVEASRFVTEHTN